MADNRYAECSSIQEVLASAGSDWYWEGDGISYDQAEARIRELVDWEEHEAFHRACDEGMRAYRKKMGRGRD